MTMVDVRFIPGAARLLGPFAELLGCTSPSAIGWDGWASRTSIAYFQLGFTETLHGGGQPPSCRRSPDNLNHLVRENLTTTAASDRVPMSRDQISE